MTTINVPIQFAASAYAGAGGRFAVSFGMLALPIVRLLVAAFEPNLPRKSPRHHPAFR